MAVARMHHLLYLLLGIGIVTSGFSVQIHAQAPAGDEVYAVSYVDVMSSGRTATIAALKQYRGASGREDGYVAIDVLEQTGRPAHFAIVERWTDQKAFEGHGAAAHTRQFRDALRPIRLSGYDERPYRPLSVAPARGRGDGQAVYVVAHVDIGGGPKADAPAMLRRLAEASRNDAGGLRFDVLQHATRGNHFTVVEVWESQAAMDAHAAAAHTKQYRDELQPISGSPLDERVYKAIE